MNLEKPKENVLNVRKSEIGKHYLKHIVLLVLWIPIVVLLFKFFDSKKIASVFASFGFLALSIFIFTNEYFGPRNKIYLSIDAVFIVFAALPVPLLRLIYWEQDYDTIVVAGIHAQSLHQISTYLYMAVLLGAVFCFMKSKMRASNK